ncbi:Alpha/Beta hydrolase protein [Boletus edulis]|uniref:Alpha/Beta hydrolase protein n=1 Tax=Boletus edulis BED1 TaxID=1328754 RepID=A0AAD4G6I4_BOLED|nr:Alpha/Beta hydrolase protein [Boletus edulis]KAF8420962.1 Alpha/Beta hydrolase protein [Boletus edulis BED1]KAF8441642.1 Alpha/Beta hydrolase protein [Boletus edulis BED1]
MIDHLLGRPNPSWKRTQVFLVTFFWIWRLVYGNPGAPRFLWLRQLNRKLQRFSPWQIIVSTLTTVYALKNLDKILGLGSPEPLARLYSPSYYRATWLVTGLDAGFATAMSIRPKWLKDICSVLFSIYYIIYANEADEKLRRFRAVPTVEMLRTTWEKTTNPYFRLMVQSPSMSLHRKILLPRPSTSTYDRPITVHIYFAPPAHQLHNATDLILDFPGGGFVAMSPDHHDERLRTWALRTGKPVLSVDYGKAPEYPYPFAMDECFDIYRLLAETCGRCIGMSGKKLNVIMSGDSAGATLVVGVMVKILQYNATLPAGETRVPAPLSLVLNYAALDFNFTSWMSPDNLRVLRTEQSTGDLPGLRELALQKNHLQHVSPLSMVGDHRVHTKRLKRHKSLKDALQDLVGRSEGVPSKRQYHMDMKRKSSVKSFEAPHDDHESWADSESEEGDSKPVREEDRSIEERVRFVYQDASSDTDDLHRVLEKQQEQLSAAVTQANLKATTLVAGSHNGKGIGKDREPIGTRLTMTSRTGYFQDRIVSPSMMRAMAILYIGPHRNPDFATDYFISPILTPSPLLAQFPPLLMQCGEKDPFVDDTVIFAGRVREAKRARKAELELVLSGKSARLGEGLRMTEVHLDDFPEDEVARMVAERDQLARETEDDWVQMVLFSDWSHGYLQMMTLMSEASAVVDDLADWIEDAFVRHSGKEERTSKVLEAAQGTGKKRETKRNSPQASRSPTKRPISYAASTANSNSEADVNGTVDASPFTSSTETDDSGITFVARKRGGSGTPMNRSRRSSDEGHDVTGMKQEYSSPPLLSESGDVAAAQRDRESANGTPRAGSGKTGQRITETEMMRRRRLLDAHIFDGPGSCT